MYHTPSSVNTVESLLIVVLFVITIHHQVYDLNVDIYNVYIWFTIHQYNIKIILIIYDLRYDLGMNIWECLPDYYYFQCSNCIFEIFMHFVAKLGKQSEPGRNVAKLWILI